MIDKHHLFENTGSGLGISRISLSTDNKPRLKWTVDLHRRFVEAVNHLGGPTIATPKPVLKAMSIPGLTLFHLKSHLQKYRQSRNVRGRAYIKQDRTVTAGQGRFQVAKGPYNGIHENRYVDEEQYNQLNLQRQHHEQLEEPHHLQLHDDTQGRYLMSVLEKVQETLGRPNLDMVGLEAARSQLSELIKKLSDQRLRSVSLETVELGVHQPNESWLLNTEGLLKGKAEIFHGVGGNFSNGGRIDRKKTGGMQFQEPSETSQMRDSSNLTEARDEQTATAHVLHLPNKKPDLNLCNSEENRSGRQNLDLNEFWC